MHLGIAASKLNHAGCVTIEVLYGPESPKVQHPMTLSCAR